MFIALFVGVALLRCYKRVLILILFFVLPTWLRLKPCSTSCFARHNGRHNIAITLIYIILYVYLGQDNEKKQRIYLICYWFCEKLCISTVYLVLHWKSLLRRIDVSWMDSIGGYYDDFRDRPDRYNVELFLFPGSSSKRSNIYTSNMLHCFFIRLERNQEIYNIKT